MRESPCLVGEKVYLRQIKREDLIHIHKWVNDPEISGLIGQVGTMSPEQVNEWFTKVEADNSRVWFVVVLKRNDRVIGEAGLLRMFDEWRTTDLTMIIGEKDAWDQGYGTEAITLLLHYAFRNLCFHRVAIGVVGFNERALHFYKKVGFKEEGLQRDGYYYNHRYYDFVMMSILDSEYRELDGGNYGTSTAG
ncbi:MAG: GNAT family protein [Armatimonadota bacterium]